MVESLVRDVVAFVAQTVGTYLPGTMFSFIDGVEAALALILVGIISGLVGSLVVGNRMAFFSDALAHCAFAGVGLGIFLGLVTGASSDSETIRWSLTPIMVVFGTCMGLSIAYVLDKTSQANDTVIGVFFAGAIGLGAIFLKAGRARAYIPPEDFLFGDLVTLGPHDILELLLLACGTAFVLIFLYNSLVFASFNPSLARSRGVPVRTLKYIFIVILALVVNVCLKVVGVLLINAMLIVPAAAAANVARNVRQLMMLSIVLAVTVGLAGQWLAWEIGQRTAAAGQRLDLGETGTIVLLAVGCYFLSIFLGRSEGRRRQWRQDPTIPSERPDEKVATNR
ncbi:MAG: metal ABC transporter permease [Gemmataceae bacterium]